jgi:hypothetical protein
MKVVNGRREGFAMVGAVLAMVLVGAIVTGGFYAAHQETQVTRSTELGDLAQYIAEQGMETVIGTTNATALDAMAMNTATTVANAVNVQYGGRTVGNYSVTITRVANMMYVVRSTGTVTVGQAANNTNSTRTLSNVIRRRTIDMDNQTAMQVYGDLTVAGTSDISGADTYRTNWSGCTTVSSGTAAVTAQPGASVTTEGSGAIAGTIRRDTMTAANFTVFGDMTWAEITSLATNVYNSNVTLSAIAPTVTSGGACNAADINNWGAPTNNSNACSQYFPIIWAKGNMHITANSTGQGILLVSGNLSIQSQFEFYGPVIVMGTVDFQGGSQIIGSVFAYGGGILGADNTTAGNMIVQYSSCGIQRAIMGATGLSRGVPIRNRSWMDLTAVQNSY